ncbi:putative cob(I)alamin adenosyltransferase [Blattamonas nauphoetae]|uniref:Cob(I)alamin adenosyltransferase n=1 Tax=Blattamonas nauphoetae TaxID=2049346 RepID=A0ABQ9XPW8_9EUKA|nr:putative cob(I)alamin adenosyltransferase [Blattamonas nauphoetae]
MFKSIATWLHIPGFNKQSEPQESEPEESTSSDNDSDYDSRGETSSSEEKSPPQNIQGDEEQSANETTDEQHNDTSQQNDDKQEVHEQITENEVCTDEKSIHVESETIHEEQHAKTLLESDETTGTESPIVQSENDLPSAQPDGIPTLPLVEIVIPQEPIADDVQNPLEDQLELEEDPITSEIPHQEHTHSPPTASIFSPSKTPILKQTLEPRSPPTDVHKTSPVPPLALHPPSNTAHSSSPPPLSPSGKTTVSARSLSSSNRNSRSTQPTRISPAISHIVIRRPQTDRGSNNQLSKSFDIPSQPYSSATSHRHPPEPNRFDTTPPMTPPEYRMGHTLRDDYPPTHHSTRSPSLNSVRSVESALIEQSMAMTSDMFRTQTSLITKLIDTMAANNTRPEKSRKRRKHSKYSDSSSSSSDLSSSSSDDSSYTRRKKRRAKRKAEKKKAEKKKTEKEKEKEQAKDTPPSEPAKTTEPSPVVPTEVSPQQVQQSPPASSPTTPLVNAQPESAKLTLATETQQTDVVKSDTLSPTAFQRKGKKKVLFDEDEPIRPQPYQLITTLGMPSQPADPLPKPPTHPKTRLPPRPPVSSSQYSSATHTPFVLTLDSDSFKPKTAKKKKKAAKKTQPPLSPPTQRRMVTPKQTTPTRRPEEQVPPKQKQTPEKQSEDKPSPVKVVEGPPQPQRPSTPTRPSTPSRSSTPSRMMQAIKSFFGAPERSDIPSLEELRESTKSLKFHEPITFHVDTGESPEREPSRSRSPSTERNEDTNESQSISSSESELSESEEQEEADDNALPPPNKIRVLDGYFDAHELLTFSSNRALPNPHLFDERMVFPFNTDEYSEEYNFPLEHPFRSPFHTRKFIHQQKWDCIPRPQYKASCGISCVVACFNFLFSSIGPLGTEYAKLMTRLAQSTRPNYSTPKTPLPPITTEQAMTILGFRPPFSEIKFGKTTGNATLMRWFSKLCLYFGQKGRSNYLWKALGSKQTLGKGEEDALRETKNAIMSDRQMIIYHCHNHYICMVGFEDTPPTQPLAYTAILPDTPPFLSPLAVDASGQQHTNSAESIHTTVLLADTSRTSQTILSARWENIATDIQIPNSQVFSIRKYYLGMLEHSQPTIILSFIHLMEGGSLIKGYTQIYTGNGKGKSTCAFGLVSRALGAGLRVRIVQFLKGRDVSELNFFRDMQAKNYPVRMEQCGTVNFIMGKPSEDDVLRAHNMYKSILSDLKAQSENKLEDESVADVLPPKMELVLTGRGASDILIKAADLVTEMKEIKHYFTEGVQARVGIEM